MNPQEKVIVAHQLFPTPTRNFCPSQNGGDPTMKNWILFESGGGKESIITIFVKL